MVLALGSLCEVEDEFERVVDSMHLIECEMPDVLAEGTRIDCSDHLAHNPRCLIVNRDLWMKACRRCRGGRGAHYDRRQREQIVGLDDDRIPPSVLKMPTAPR
jgi:hypothetical protein